MNIGKMMKQVQDMQGKMAEMQNRLGEVEVTGQSGGGLVTVTMNGKGEMRKINIDAKLLSAEEKEMLEDMIVAATNDAKAKAEAHVAGETEKMMGGLQLPPGVKLPFKDGIMNPSHFDPALHDKAAYKFWVKDLVRFTDLDALGHVSAVRTNEYFNTARARFFQQTVEGWPQAPQVPVLKLSTIQYEQEIHFPDELDVGLVIEKFGNTSATVVLGLFNNSGCLALTRNIFVFIDTSTRKPTVPSDLIKQNFAKHGGAF